MRRAGTFGVLMLGIAIGAAPLAAVAGTLYRFVDARGVVHFTDSPRHAGFVPIRPRERVARGSGVRPRPHESYDAVIAAAAQRHAVPPALVKAVVAAESAFDASAVSRKGAMGLMQIMPGTANELGLSRPFVAEANVDAGTRYLKWLHQRYGDWFRALAAYNAGPTAVDRYGGIPPYRETRAYVDRVLTYYRRWDGDFSR